MEELLVLEVKEEVEVVVELAQIVLASDINLVEVEVIIIEVGVMVVLGVEAEAAEKVEKEVVDGVVVVEPMVEAVAEAAHLLVVVEMEVMVVCMVAVEVVEALVIIGITDLVYLMEDKEANMEELVVEVHLIPVIPIMELMAPIHLHGQM